MLTRFLPFMVFHDTQATPKFIQQLGNFLPAAILGMLVIYCYRDFAVTLVSIKSIMAIISGIVTILVHYLYRNMLLSIATGTISCMALLALF